MISLTEKAERTRFHDASLGKCLSEGNLLQLKFQNIITDIGTEEYSRASVVLSGVQEIRRFDEPVAQLTTEGEGKVLQFHRGEGKARLLVEWHFYQPNARVFAEYEIDYASSSITAEKQDGLIVD